MERDPWRLYEYAKRLHATLKAVVCRDHRCTYETVDAVQLSSVLKRLADDQALSRRGLNLVRNLEHYFRAGVLES